MDGVMGDSWMRRRTSDRPPLTTADSQLVETPLETHAEDSRGILDGDLAPPADHLEDSPASIHPHDLDQTGGGPEASIVHGDLHRSIGLGLPSSSQNGIQNHDIPLLNPNFNANNHSQPQIAPPMPNFSNEAVEWRYQDQQGLIQGSLEYSSKVVQGN